MTAVWSWAQCVNDRFYVYICYSIREKVLFFPRHRLQKIPLLSDPGMHQGTCVTHVPWCMSGLLTRGGGENGAFCVSGMRPVAWSIDHIAYMRHSASMSTGLWCDRDIKIQVESSKSGAIVRSHDHAIFAKSISPEMSRRLGSSACSSTLSVSHSNPCSPGQHIPHDCFRPLFDRCGA